MRSLWAQEVKVGQFLHVTRAPRSKYEYDSKIYGAERVKSQRPICYGSYVKMLTGKFLLWNNLKVRMNVNLSENRCRIDFDDRMKAHSATRRHDVSFPNSYWSKGRELVIRLTFTFNSYGDDF